MLGVATMMLVAAVAARPEDAPMDELVRGNTRFALDLFRKIGDRPGNLFLSTYSISTALAMTSAGARGETARQMAATLRFPIGGDALHSAFSKLDRSIVGAQEPRPYQLEVANALWVDEGLAPDADFVKLAGAYYGAGPRPVDFAGDPDSARREINAWVEQRTRDKIKDLLSTRDVDRSTELILTNVIYFKGTWTVPFPKSDTKEAAFSDGLKSVPAPLMHLTDRLGYLDSEADGLQALELPYAGDALSMVILLPKRRDGMAALESKLSAPGLEDWLAKLSRSPVEVALPRFKLECRFELADALIALGMTLPFGRDADFSGMASNRRLRISRVIHKAFAEVNEEGTEAAAATAVVAMRSMARPGRPAVFRADRPFLFLIRDVRSKSILFLGRVTDPTG